MIPKSESLDAVIATTALPPFATLSNGDTAKTRTTEDLEYWPVPPRSTVAIKVRCVNGGRGRPMPYHFDDEIGE